MTGATRSERHAMRMVCIEAPAPCSTASCQDHISSRHILNFLACWFLEVYLLIMRWGARSCNCASSGLAAWPCMFVAYTLPAHVACKCPTMTSAPATPHHQSPCLLRLQFTVTVHWFQTAQPHNIATQYCRLHLGVTWSRAFACLHAAFPWLGFCDDLKMMARCVVEGPSGIRLSALDRAEGVRFLTRLLRGGACQSTLWYVDYISAWHTACTMLLSSKESRRVCQTGIARPRCAGALRKCCGTALMLPGTAVLPVVTYCVDAVA